MLYIAIKYIYISKRHWYVNFIFETKNRIDR